MLSISEPRPIPGQQHWETIVLFRTDSQGILGLLALRENNVLFMISLKNWTTPPALPDRAAVGLVAVVTCLLALKLFAALHLLKKKYFKAITMKLQTNGAF